MSGWLVLLLCVGAFLVGMMVGATRAHAENSRYLDKVDEWVRKQRR